MHKENKKKMSGRTVVDKKEKSDALIVKTDESKFPEVL